MQKKTINGQTVYIYEHSDVEHMLKKIGDEGSRKLNDWERSFINDMNYKVGFGQMPTEMQIKKIEEIYVRST